jgi:hypothetical protein
MKDPLRQLCRPLLRHFEEGSEPYQYKPLNRKILLILGSLFVTLAALVVLIAPAGSGLGMVFPVLVFGGGGVLCLIVGGLGNDRAVAKIWGNR